MSLSIVKPVTKKNWVLGDKFENRMPHHDGIKQLWETKWKFPVSHPLVHNFGNFLYTSD